MTLYHITQGILLLGVFTMFFLGIKQLLHTASCEQKTRLLYQTIIKSPEEQPISYYLEKLNIFPKDEYSERECHRIYEIAFRIQYLNLTSTNPILEPFSSAIHHCSIVQNGFLFPKTRKSIKEETEAFRQIWSTLKTEPDNNLIDVKQDENFTTFIRHIPRIIQNKPILAIQDTITILNSDLANLP